MVDRRATDRKSRRGIKQVEGFPRFGEQAECRSGPFRPTLTTGSAQALEEKTRLAETDLVMNYQE